MRTKSLAMQLEGLRIHCARLETELAGYKAMEQERKQREAAKAALALAPEAMSEEQLEDAICCQLEFLKNVGHRVSGTDPLFSLPPVERLKALDALCAQVLAKASS